MRRGEEGEERNIGGREQKRIGRKRKRTEEYSICIIYNIIYNI